MVNHIFDLPEEMISEVAQYAGYSGLLVLRQVCQRMRAVVENVCKITGVRFMMARRGSTQMGNLFFILHLSTWKPPLFMLPYSVFCCRLMHAGDAGGKKKMICYTTFPPEVFPAFLTYIRPFLQRVPIDFFFFHSTDEEFTSLINTFKNGLNINDRCLQVCKYEYRTSDCDDVIDTIRSQQYNAASVSLWWPKDKILQLADAVDTLVLMDTSKYEMVPLVLDIFSKRCTYVYIVTADISQTDVDQLVEMFTKSDKALYISVLVKADVHKKAYRCGSFNIDIAQDKWKSSDSTRLEIRHDNVKRKIDHF